MRADTNIKKARLKSHMTQEQVAEELNVSRQTVSNWENGKTFPDTANIIRLSEMYHVSTDFLLRGVEDESVPDAVRPESEENPTVKIPETTMGKGKSKEKSWSMAHRTVAILMVFFALILIYVLVPHLTNNRSENEDTTEQASADYVSISNSAWGDIILETSDDLRERYKYVEMSESILKTLSTEDLLRLAVVNPSTEGSLSISSDITSSDAVARLVSRSSVYEILMNRDDVIETIYSVHDTLYEDVKDYLYDARCEETGMDVDMSIIEESYNQTLAAYISYIEQNKTLTDEQEDMIQELSVMLV